MVRGLFHREDDAVHLLGDFLRLAQLRIAPASPAAGQVLERSLQRRNGLSHHRSISNR